MKTNLLNIAVLSAVAISSIVTSAHADDWHKKRDHKDERKAKVTVVIDDHHHHGRPYRRGPRPVYIAPRPVYVAPRPVVVSPAPALSLEASVQRELARRGYYGGVIDGDIGPRSRASIRVYQVDKGLPVSGRIDTPLLRSLGLL